MEIQVQVHIGITTVTVKASTVIEAIDGAAFFSALPGECPVCRAPVSFTARHPQSFHYYGLRCEGSPSHETTFGVHKEGGGLFYKEREPWTTWQGAGGVDTDFDVKVPSRDELAAELKEAVRASGWPMARFLEDNRIPDPTKISDGRIKELIMTARALARSAV